MAVSKNIFGLPLGSTYTLINSNFVLNKVNGSVLKANVVLEPLLRDVLAKPSSPSSPPPPSAASVLAKPEEVIIIKKEVEVVVGVDKKVIDLSLISAEGDFTKDGYLVEVYLSGTDGKLTRVYREDVVDVLNDDVIQEGFGKYLILRVE